MNFKGLLLAFGILTASVAIESSCQGMLPAPMVYSNNPEYRGMLVPMDTDGIEDLSCYDQIEDDVIREGLSECYGSLTYGEAWVQLNSYSHSYGLPRIGGSFRCVIPYIYENRDCLRELFFFEELSTMQYIRCCPEEYMRRLFDKFDDATVEEIFSSGACQPILANLLGETYQGWMDIIVGVSELED